MERMVGREGLRSSLRHVAKAPLLMLFALLGCQGQWAQRPLENRLVIYSSTDQAQFNDVLRAFSKENPSTKIVYQSLSASDVYSKTRGEADRHEPSADLVISSAMDLQIKLVNDRYTQTYSSPLVGMLPPGMVWKNQAFAVTSEPIVIGYNKRLISPSQLPHDHDQLASLLHSQVDRFRGRVALYDPARSPTGFLYITQDLHIDRDNWDLIAAIGLAKPKAFISTADMIDQVSSGKLLIAYNLIGSYAMDRAKNDPNFGVIIPQDYVLVGSRVALIARDAAHPQAARKFLDFMLSRKGQGLLAQHNMIPLRTDMRENDAVMRLGNARVIHVGPALMAGLDETNRERFFVKWKDTIRASPVGNKS